MSILFNTNLLTFESGHSTGGIDIAAWNADSDTFLLHKFNCFIANPSKCDHYELGSASTRNTLAIEDNYGIAKFDCGILSNTQSDVTHCDNFRGNAD
jgi:hypothetical protein